MALPSVARFPYIELETGSQLQALACIVRPSRQGTYLVTSTVISQSTLRTQLLRPILVEATRTGMVPDSVTDEVRSNFLDPDIIVPPLTWLISHDADEVTDKRLVATKWNSDLGGTEAAQAAVEGAGW